MSAPTHISEQLHRELWTSWASLLRSYAAAHSLGREQHAVVEVSDTEILLRYGTRFARFTPVSFTGGDGRERAFALTEDGRAVIGETEDEMDLSAERLIREIIDL